jgi:hypothetical protein
VPRRAGVCALLALAAAFAGGQSPAGACACGIAIEASAGEEAALVIEHGAGESIVLSLDLVADDPTSRPAVVVPVPALPTVAAVEDGDPLAYLEQATAPSRATQAGGEDEAAGAGVEVIGRDRIGGYDVARLGAADGAALEAWLDENEYTLPAGAEPILSEYAEEEWRFVAIKLARGADGVLKPPKISCESEETVYPMRLQQIATQPLALTLFVLARAERRVKGLERTFSAPVGELEPPPPPEIAKLIPDDRHVTRIEAEIDPERARRDLVIEAIPGPPGSSGDSDEGFSTLAFVLVAAGGLLVLVVAFVIKARRDRRLLEQP